MSNVRKSLDEGVDLIAECPHHSDESGERAENTGKASKHVHTQNGMAHKGGTVHGAKSRHTAAGHDSAILIPEPPVIDRSTAKAISMLVLERDGKGVIPRNPSQSPRKGIQAARRGK